MCRTAVSGKQVRYRNILCPQKEEDLTSQIIQVYFRLVYFHIYIYNLLKNAVRTSYSNDWNSEI
jgi:hypothetical protein